jgi:hypothetical protein
MAFRMTPARKAALRKAQLASARKRKRGFHAANRKKLQSRRSKRKGITEYVTASGQRTGLATNTPSKTFGGAMRKARRASKHNVKYAKKLSKHNKRINKLKARTNAQPLKHRALSKLQGKNPHSRRATFVAEKSARFGRKKKRR